MLSLKMECFANLVIKINTAPSTVSRTLHRFLYETVITPVEMKTLFSETWASTAYLYGSNSRMRTSDKARTTPGDEARIGMKKIQRVP